MARHFRRPDARQLGASAAGQSQRYSLSRCLTLHWRDASGEEVSKNELFNILMQQMFADFL